eukprot:Sspe_Gene.9413::Locus_3165_Transcript_1_1_Confidence_1.000_Length_1449::g.9413::m.9413
MNSRNTVRRPAAARGASGMPAYLRPHTAMGKTYGADAAAEAPVYTTQPPRSDFVSPTSVSSTPSNMASPLTDPLKERSAATPKRHESLPPPVLPAKRSFISVLVRPLWLSAAALCAVLLVLSHFDPCITRCFLFSCDWTMADISQADIYELYRAGVNVCDFRRDASAASQTIHRVLARQYAAAALHQKRKVLEEGIGTLDLEDEVERRMYASVPSPGYSVYHIIFRTALVKACETFAECDATSVSLRHAPSLFAWGTVYDSTTVQALLYEGALNLLTTVLLPIATLALLLYLAVRSFRQRQEAREVIEAAYAVLSSSDAPLSLPELRRRVEEKVGNQTKVRTYWPTPGENVGPVEYAIRDDDNIEWLSSGLVDHTVVVSLRR